jgi:pimeloyl-ACP methyl ester carboxylesterase
MRGHGGLPQDANYIEQGITDYAQDVVDAQTYLSRPVVIVSHSLGALVGMRAAEQAAPVAQVLLAPSPPGQLEGLHKLKAYPEERPVQPPHIDTAQEKFFSGEPFDMQSIFPLLCAESPRAMNDRYLLRIDIDASWVKGPTLCLSAGLDSVTLHPPGQDRATADFFAGHHEVLEQVPHNMMIASHWQNVAELTEQFYRKHFA